MLDIKGVSEENWRDAGTADSNFLESESPLYVGRAVAALAADSHMLERTGQLWSSPELAPRLRFHRCRRPPPRLGRPPPIQTFRKHPPAFVEMFRTRLALQHASG